MTDDERIAAKRINDRVRNIVIVYLFIAVLTFGHAHNRTKSYMNPGYHITAFLSAVGLSLTWPLHWSNVLWEKAND